MTTFETPTTSRADVTRWCKAYIAKILNVAPEGIDEDMDFNDLGLDSSLAVSLLIEIEQVYGVEISTEALFMNPSIAAVSALVCEGLAGEARP